MSRILAVDPGERRIGLAVTDPTRTIVIPLSVLRHVSRDQDARRIVEIARGEEAEAIVVGVAYGPEGEVGRSARRGLRLADAIRRCGFASVDTIDESGSTAQAESLHDRDAMTDARAAAVILQSYLDARAA